MNEHSSSKTLAQIESVCMFKGSLNCLVNDMLYIKQLRPPLNLQTDLIHAICLCLAVFIHANLEYLQN